MMLILDRCVVPSFAAFTVSVGSPHRGCDAMLGRRMLSEQAAQQQQGGKAFMSSEQPLQQGFLGISSSSSAYAHTYNSARRRRSVEMMLTRRTMARKSDEELASDYANEYDGLSDEMKAQLDAVLGGGRNKLTDDKKAKVEGERKKIREEQEQMQEEAIARQKQEEKDEEFEEVGRQLWGEGGKERLIYQDERYKNARNDDGANQEFTATSNVGVGTKGWGDSSRGYGVAYKTRDLKKAFDYLVANGITYFDTSESYYGSKGHSHKKGKESAETLLGAFNDNLSDKKYRNLASIGTKFLPKARSVKTGNFGQRLVRKFFSLPRYGSSSVVKAVGDSSARCGNLDIDLYQLETQATGSSSRLLRSLPYFGGTSALIRGLAESKQRGLCNYVGVSNVIGGAAVRNMHQQFRLHGDGIKLASNTFAFSLTNRAALFDGTIDACQSLGIAPIAHSPLDGGLASGKTTLFDPTGGRPGKKYPRFSYIDLEPLQPLHTALAEVANSAEIRMEAYYRKMEVKEGSESKAKKRMWQTLIANLDVSTTQVSLNYIRAQGVIPIPSITNLAQAKDLVKSLEFDLTDDEVEILDDAASEYEEGRRK
jgi:pyridoxine 4-dehydrogenase